MVWSCFIIALVNTPHMFMNHFIISKNIPSLYVSKIGSVYFIWKSKSCERYFMLFYVCRSKDKWINILELTLHDRAHNISGKHNCYFNTKYILFTLNIAQRSSWFNIFATQELILNISMYGANVSDFVQFIWHY